MSHDGHAEQARQVADAILYEGYLLYPYRGSAQKNQERFQFGVLMPPSYQAVDDCEPSATQTQCVLECPDSAEVQVHVRFLHVHRRTVEAAQPGSGFRETASLMVDGTEYIPWDEAAEREQEAAVPLASLLERGAEVAFNVPGGVAVEEISDSSGQTAGRLVRRWPAIRGRIGVSAERLPGPYRALRLTVRVENHTEPDIPLRRRADGLRFAMVAAHSLIGVPGGTFLSMTSPPEWAAADVAACENIKTWPVLAGPEDCEELVLSSPVILYDHPQIAAESAGELYDSTEIDEILTLRTMTLTDEEKRQARATDPRAAALMDRLDHLPPEMLERMHGAIRYLRPAGRDAALPGDPGLAGMPGLAGAPGMEPPVPAAPDAPWWDPGSDSSVSPETDHVVIAGVRVARGSRVLMCPGARRADAQDLFLTGRPALVEAILSDVDGNVHLAVLPEDDPAADMQRNHGRFLYFAPDEVEPLAAAPGTTIGESTEEADS